jgi:hypothetical protein
MHAQRRMSPTTTGQRYCMSEAVVRSGAGLGVVALQVWRLMYPSHFGWAAGMPGVTPLQRQNDAGGLPLGCYRIVLQNPSWAALARPLGKVWRPVWGVGCKVIGG